MSKRALRMVFDWMELHQSELENNWHRAKQRKALERIAPLS